MRHARGIAALVIVAAVAVGGAACGDDGDSEAAGTATDTAATTVAAPAEIEVPLAAQNESGVSGTATFTDLGNGKTRVVIAATDVADAPPRPAHVHAGSCADLDPAPAWGLLNVTDGASETVLATPLQEMVDGDFAVNVHQSVDNLDAYIACGNIG